MAPQHEARQLELFEFREHAAPRPHREALGRFFFQFRYDQLVLAGIALLIGVTVIFAGGVERGKQLARGERLLLARPKPAEAVAPSRATDVRTPELKRAGESRGAVPDSPVKAKVPSGAAVRTPGPSAPSAPSKSRYVIQVVTYTRPQLAKREMDRLRARGEPAFLLMRDGRTMVLVGPFPSKGNASEKLVGLKGSYGDCFLRTL